MAKIKSIFHDVNGTRTEFPVKVTVKGVFWTTLPAEVADFADRDDILEAKTLDGLSNTLSDMISKYNNSSDEISFVLCYEIRTKVTTTSSYPRGYLDIVFTPYRKRVLGKNTVYNFLHKRFRIDRDEEDDPNVPISGWNILGNTVQENSRVTNEYVHPFSKSPSVHTIELTQQNFDFFVNLCEQLRKLNDKLTAFLGDSPEHLLQVIQNMPNIKFLTPVVDLYKED